MVGLFKGHNIVPKLKIILILTTLLLFGIFITGCAKKANNVNTSQEVGEKFLNQLFTSNYENRYTEFLADNDIDKYYDTFSKYTSQECLEKLEQDRMPIKYDKEAQKDNVFLSVSDIKIEFDEKGVGQFEVFLNDQNDKETIIKKATGQITKKENKITSFFLSNVVNVEDNL